jgi:hypothetical protein
MFPIHWRLMLLTALQSASLDPARAGLMDKGDTMNCEKLGSCACKALGIPAAKAKPKHKKIMCFLDFFMSSH